MRNRGSLDCFETFPFPKPDPRAVIPALEDVGQRLYDLRAKYMVDENVGLTITYNRLKDPACDDARIQGLRKLHEKALEQFEDAVIDRLFLLNAKRAEEEKIKGLGTTSGKKKPAPKKPAANTPSATPRAKKPRARKKTPEGQLELGDGGEE